MPPSEKRSRKVYRIDVWVSKGLDVTLMTGMLEKPQIEGSILDDHRSIAQKRKKVTNYRKEIPFPPHHRIGDSRKSGYKRIYRSTGVDQLRIGFFGLDFPISNHYRSYFYDA